MFIGEYYHNLDAKGRIIIPAKFRDELNGTFILTRGLDGCLTIYSTEKWEKIFEEINKLSFCKSPSFSMYIISIFFYIVKFCRENT